MIKDGTYIPALKNASVLKDDKGVVLGAVEILSDLSELARLDEKVEFLSRKLEEDIGFHGIIGKSAPMQKLFDILQNLSQDEVINA